MKASEVREMSISDLREHYFSFGGYVKDSQVQEGYSQNDDYPGRKGKTELKFQCDGKKSS